MAQPSLARADSTVKYERVSVANLFYRLMQYNPATGNVPDGTAESFYVTRQNFSLTGQIQSLSGMPLEVYQITLQPVEQRGLVLFLEALMAWNKAVNDDLVKKMVASSFAVEGELPEDKWSNWLEDYGPPDSGSRAAHYFLNSGSLLVNTMRFGIDEDPSPISYNLISDVSSARVCIGNVSVVFSQRIVGFLAYRFLACRTLTSGGPYRSLKFDVAIVNKLSIEADETAKYPDARCVVVAQRQQFCHVALAMMMPVPGNPRYGGFGLKCSSTALCVPITSNELFKSFSVPVWNNVAAPLFKNASSREKSHPAVTGESKESEEYPLEPTTELNLSRKGLMLLKNVETTRISPDVMLGSEHYPEEFKTYFFIRSTNPNAILPASKLLELARYLCQNPAVKGFTEVDINSSDEFANPDTALSYQVKTDFDGLYRTWGKTIKDLIDFRNGKRGIPTRTIIAEANTQEKAAREPLFLLLEKIVGNKDRTNIIDHAQFFAERFEKHPEWFLTVASEKLQTFPEFSYNMKRETEIFMPAHQKSLVNQIFIAMLGNDKFWKFNTSIAKGYLEEIANTVAAR